MSDNKLYAEIRQVASTLLRKDLRDGAESLPEGRIAEAVESAIAMLEADGVDVARLVADLEASFQTAIGSERILSDGDGWAPWLKKRKAAISWAFWERYRGYLLQEKGWAPKTIDRLDTTTDSILEYLMDPLAVGQWDRRGLVVGHVQSGKTSNYIGLITKAVDAGYKIIVVLAGFHKSLRSQTQIRLEEGFLGYTLTAQPGSSSVGRIPVGVGNAARYGLAPKVDSITTRADNGDFKKVVANNFGINPGGNPLLFVIKKNGSVLKNLLTWVRGIAGPLDEDGRSSISDVPLLVIDDEADQGSIDTNKVEYDTQGRSDRDHDPTTLNRRIRQLLMMFGQSAYVGYTATPFANILIHEEKRTDREGDDLFPRSFIVSLPFPSNYLGPSRLFGLTEGDAPDEQLPIMRYVTDHADSLELDEKCGWVPPKHNKNLRPKFNGLDQVPPSLAEAIRAFVLVCAAREARGDRDVHNTMLVHVTRFTAVQGLVKEQVTSELTDIKNRLRHGDGESRANIRAELEALWREDFEATTATLHSVGEANDCNVLSWSDVEPLLNSAALSITVRAVNGLAGDALDYVLHEKTGLNVIAIGGDKLSRGLTLEGLSVSYFLRASRMYDTLMQMGRWFGYRPRFLDLCRLYTTPEMVQWFRHIAEASEELREDFDRMALSGGTPRDFGHRVKSHPAMLVTSAVKMRDGTPIDLSFSGAITETINFHRSKALLDKNWQAGAKLAKAMAEDGMEAEPSGSKNRSTNGDRSGGWVWRGVSCDAVLAFLDDYEAHPASIRVKTALLSNYVREERKNGRLTYWTVLLASRRSQHSCSFGAVQANLVDRSWHANKGPEREALKNQGHFRIGRLVDPPDEYVDLSDDERSQALEMTISDWKNGLSRAKKEPTLPSGKNIREVRSEQNGLLMLYPMSWGPDDDEKVADEARGTPILGFAVSFPTVESGGASQVQYVVNNVYWKQEVGSSQEDGDDEGL